VEDPVEFFKVLAKVAGQVPATANEEEDDG